MTLKTTDDMLQHQSPGKMAIVLYNGNLINIRPYGEILFAGLCLMALVKDIDQCQTNWHLPFGHYPVTKLVM